MNCFLVLVVSVLLTYSMCLGASGTEYCLRPTKIDTTQASSVICCSTPTGWESWKDDPHYQDRIKRLGIFDRSWLRRLVSFSQPKCKKGPKCPYLVLDTKARDSRGNSDIQAGLRDFLDNLEQRQDFGPREHPCRVASRFDSFSTENSGTLTIWQISCPSGSQHFVTLLAQRDVFVIIHLAGPDIKDLMPKLDRLKELARSVRIVDASLELPDIIKIDAAHVSDKAIRRQLLQLTPSGTPMQNVHDILEWRLGYEGLELGGSEKLHWVTGDLQMRIDSYPNTDRFPTVVQALWKSDKQHVLRDIEIRRRVIEHKVKRAVPVTR